MPICILIFLASRARWKPERQLTALGPIHTPVFRILLSLFLLQSAHNRNIQYITTNKKIEASVIVYTCDVRKLDRNTDPFFLYPFFAYVRFLAILLPFYSRSILRTREMVCNDGCRKKQLACRKRQERLDRWRTKAGKRRRAIKRRKGGRIKP